MNKKKNDNRSEEYDVTWSEGSLSIRFTPNEEDLPVISQIPRAGTSAANTAPLAAVGDVLFAYQVHAERKPMRFVKNFEEICSILQDADLPITLRFRSRKREVPTFLPRYHLARTYSYRWRPNEPLGLSLMMDPCSLHTCIIAIDDSRVPLSLKRLIPRQDDILIEIKDENNQRVWKTEEMRFERVIEILREVPRPCILTFTTLKDPNVDENVPLAPPPVIPNEDLPLVEDSPKRPRRDMPGTNIPPAPKSAPAASPSSSSFSSSSSAASKTTSPPKRQPEARTKKSSRPMVSYPSRSAGAPSSTPPRPRTRSQVQASTTSLPIEPMNAAPQMPPVPMDTSVPPLRRPRPISHQQSIQVDIKTDHQKDPSIDPATTTPQRYEVLYHGGRIGLVLKENSEESRGYCIIKKITDPTSAVGLDQAREGDELIAIGPLDLKNIAFDQVLNELRAVREPTFLLFRRRTRHLSVTKALADALMLFLI